MKVWTRILIMAAVAAGALASLALAGAAPASNPSTTCFESGDAVGPPGEALELGSHGACVSTTATGDLSGSAYAANCKLLEEVAFGSYPYSFYGNPDYTAQNRADCIYFLRAFHTGQLPPGPGE